MEYNNLTVKLEGGEKYITQYEGASSPMSGLIKIFRLEMRNTIRFLSHETVHLLLFREIDYQTSAMLDNIYFQVGL